MFGFHLDGVDYAKDVDLEVAIPSLEKFIEDHSE